MRPPGLRSLLPYLQAHRRALVLVAVLSLVRAGGTLLQPLLTREVLNGVGKVPVWGPVGLLVLVLGVVAVLDGIQDYLLSRTAEGIVLSARTRLAPPLLRLARTIRASNAQERESAGVAAAARAAFVSGLRVARLRALVGPAATAAVQGAFLVVVGVGGTRVATGSLTIGDLVAFVLFLFFLVMPLAQAMHAYTQLQTGLGALQRMEEVLDLPDEEATDRPRVGAAVSPAAAAVEFDRVTFAYPGGEPVLREVSFPVHYGTRTALVGPSGAGKSTVLALVARFYGADREGVSEG